MRRFALGRLGYSPGRFGLMPLGDFLDAMAGYNEGENERIKSIAGLIRTSTTILLNIQLAKGDRLTPQELWPFPWDEKEPEQESVEVDTEKRALHQAKMIEILNKIQPDHSPLKGPG